MEIGLRYEEVKKSLIVKIKAGVIQGSEEEAVLHTCYFCNSRIEGKMWILRENIFLNGVELKSSYFVDDFCYQISVGYVQRDGGMVFLN